MTEPEGGAGSPARTPVMTATEVHEFLGSVMPAATDRFEVLDVAPMAARVRMRIDEGNVRPGGTVSGPSLMALADTAMWVAVLAMIGPVALSVTQHLAIDFLRKPSLVDVVADARIHRLGSRLAVGDVLMYSDGDGDDDGPVARATVTYSIPSPPPT